MRFTEDKVITEVVRQVALNDLIMFCLLTKKDYKATGYLRYVAKVLEKVESGEIKRVIISMPPRHGKSEIAVRRFVPWYLMRGPEREVIVASYGAALAHDLSRSVRRVVQEWGGVLAGVEINEEKSSVERWELTAGGAMTAAGIGGAITGRGGHLLIVDDVIKNEKEAMSATYREGVWEWFNAVFRTRAAPDAAMVVIATRWHKDDLIGRLLAREGDKWLNVKLPALAEVDDVVGRGEGEPLGVEMGFDDKYYAEIREAIGAYWFNALYQQAPIDKEGRLFKREWFKYFTLDESGGVIDYGEGRVPLDKVKKIIVCDLAVSLSSKADYFVLGVFGFYEDKVFILDWLRARLPANKQMDVIKSYYERWGVSYVGIEAVAYQLALVQLLRKEGLPVKKISADKDKISRALVASVKAEAGQVYLRAGAGWLYEFEDEVLEFPDTAHDDQVDVLAYGCIEQGRSSIRDVIY